jgi:hypothetical protein
MIDHPFSLQGMSTLASPHVSLVRLPTKELSGTHAAPFVSVTLPFFFLHFSVIRFRRRKLVPAALVRVPGARASDVLASHTCRQHQQQESKHLFIGVDFFWWRIAKPYLSCSARFRLRSCSDAKQASKPQQGSVIVTLNPGHADACGGRVGTLDSLRAWVRGGPGREMNRSGTLRNLATLFRFPFLLHPGFYSHLTRTRTYWHARLSPRRCTYMYTHIYMHIHSHILPNRHT